MQVFSTNEPDSGQNRAKACIFAGIPSKQATSSGKACISAGIFAEYLQSTFCAPHKTLPNSSDRPDFAELYAISSGFPVLQRFPLYPAGLSTALKCVYYLYYSLLPSLYFGKPFADLIQGKTALAETLWIILQQPLIEGDRLLLGDLLQLKQTI